MEVIKKDFTEISQEDDNRDYPIILPMIDSVCFVKTVRIDCFADLYAIWLSFRDSVNGYNYLIGDKSPEEMIFNFCLHLAQFYGVKVSRLDEDELLAILPHNLPGIAGSSINTEFETIFFDSVVEQDAFMEV